MAGNTSQSDTKYTGNNATITPSSTTWLVAQTTGGGEATEASLTSTASQIFSLELIDKAVLKAKTLTPVLRPVKTGNAMANYVMFITPEQHYDLRRNTSSNEYLDIQKAVIQGGRTSDNPLFTGALGMYNGVVLHESFRLPRITAASVANGGGRAVMCGAQAAVMAFGRDNGPGRFTWVEELFDFQNRLGIAAGMIGGIKKTVYNSRDFATITISTIHSQAARTASGR